jgi:uroporphyrinogen decarboxylase
MDSREIVQRTLDYENPERVARFFTPSDFVMSPSQSPLADKKWKKVNDREWRKTDEWGNVWGRVDDTSKGEVIKGALETLDDVEKVTLPDFTDPACYAVAEETFTNNPDLWHIGSIHGLTFSIARKVRKMEQYFIDLMLDRDRLKILHDRIDEQIRHQILGMKDAGANSIMFFEDWGTQEQLLINPELWRDEFKPRFKAQCEFAHQQGLKMFMHSCGKITAIIPDLIECGIDLLQFDQPTLHGIDTLGEMQELGMVTFWCSVDIQRTLQTCDEAAIRKEASEMIETLWKGRGGFVAGYYEDNASLGLDPKWQRIAIDEFVKKGTIERFV